MINPDKKLIGRLCLLLVNPEYANWDWSVWTSLSSDDEVYYNSRLGIKGYKFTDSICEIVKALPYNYLVFNFENNCYLKMDHKDLILL